MRRLPSASTESSPVRPATTQSDETAHRVAAARRRHQFPYREPERACGHTPPDDQGQTTPDWLRSQPTSDQHRTNQTEHDRGVADAPDLGRPHELRPQTHLERRQGPRNRFESAQVTPEKRSWPEETASQRILRPRGDSQCSRGFRDHNRYPHHVRLPTSVNQNMRY